MALSALIQWEVRPANGTANAGGGFRAGASGTDRSQQNAVQTAFTDLVIDAVTNTNVTSAAFPFAAADVGNVIAVTGGAGFTTGLYEVVSVAAAVATLDRAVGTVGSTGGTGNLGGARSGYSVGTTTLQSSLVAGQKVWIKNEAWNEPITLTAAGAAGNPIVHEGYNTARGDAPTGANRPRNNRAGAAGVALTAGGANQQFRHLWMSNAGTHGVSDASANHTYVNVRSSNNTDRGFTSGSGSEILFLGCESDTNGGHGFIFTTSQVFVGCTSHDNTGVGYGPDAAGGQSLVFCIAESNASHGLSASTRIGYVANCTFDGNTGASTDGITMTTPVGSNVVLNTICSNNGRDGARATDGDSIYADYNDFYGNGGVARTNFPTGANDQAVDPQFTDRAGGDFSIGANLKALGWPGLFPAGLSTGYLDIGAVQRQEPAGGGGGGLARIIGG